MTKLIKDWAEELSHWVKCFLYKCEYPAPTESWVWHRVLNSIVRWTANSRDPVSNQDRRWDHQHQRLSDFYICLYGWWACPSIFTRTHTHIHHTYTKWKKRIPWHSFFKEKKKVNSCSPNSSGWPWVSDPASTFPVLGSEVKSTVAGLCQAH